MRYLLVVVIAIVVIVLLLGVYARAQSSTPPIAVYRAGIFCVFVGPSGIALTAYEVYDHATYRLVPCPALGDPGPMASPTVLQ